MRSLRVFALVLALIGLSSLVACGDSRRAPVKVEADKSAKADKENKEKPVATDLADLNADIVVLQVLHALEASAELLDEMAKLVSKTAQKPPAIA